MPDDSLVMQTLLEQNKMLGSISSKLDGVDKKLDGHIADDTKAHARISKLEVSHNRMQGAAAAWSLLVSVIVSAASWYFGGNGSTPHK